MKIQSHPDWKKLTSTQKPILLSKIFFSRHYSRFLKKDVFISVVGTVGKSTTVLASKAVLSKKFKTVSTDPAISGSVLDFPQTILKIPLSTQKVILEMGTDFPGEMDFYLNLITPKIVIVTKLYFDNNEYLKDVDEIIKENIKLVEKLPKDGMLILNWDDPASHKIAERTVAQVVYYGCDEKNCHVWAGNIRSSHFQTNFELNYGVERVEIQSPFLGVHQIYSLLAAAALGINEGIPLLSIKKAFENLSPLDHRLEQRIGVNNSTILDDTSTSSPLALEEALDTLNQVPARRRIVVLGEMKRLGSFSEKLHKQIAQKIYKDRIDIVLLGSGETSYISEELLRLGFIPERLESDLSNQQMVAKLLKILSKGDVVLVKGDDSSRFDEIIKKIAKAKRD